VNYRNRLLRNLIALVFLGQSASVMWGQAGLTFGPEDFTRQSRPQVEVVRNFTVQNPIKP
jgi:hypothetical protein